jgi:hypothetical protein
MMCIRTFSFLLSLKALVLLIALLIILGSFSFVYNTPVVVPVVEPIVQEARTRFGLISACVVPVSPLQASMYNLEVVQVRYFTIIIIIISSCRYLRHFIVNVITTGRVPVR